MSHSLRIARFTVLLLISYVAPLYAQDNFFDWHSANIQLLKGWNYEAGPSKRAIITFEYANAWRYGDFYMFVDYTRFDKGGTNRYGEVTPRFSIGKLSGKDLSYGVIKDYLVALSVEKGRGDTKAYLYGGAIDFNFPGFKFFKFNLYHRNNPEIRSNGTYQVTLVWNYPFTAYRKNFLIEGFADFAGDEGKTYHRNQLIVPRFLMDVSTLVGQKKGKVFAGIEYSYWHNKLGRRGETESTPQLQVKWVF